MEELAEKFLVVEKLLEEFLSNFRSFSLHKNYLLEALLMEITWELLGKFPEELLEELPEQFLVKFPGEILKEHPEELLEDMLEELQ